MELLIVTKCFFITGTDTGVGKTIASIALLQAAKMAGFTTVGYKPVASGSEITEKGLRNKDALALQHVSSITLPYESINPYTFAEPTSPHIVSNKEGRPILFSTLSINLRMLETKAEWIFIEGAGGWFTPLTKTFTFANWVIYEQLPVILVIGIKLGCINHALLTSEVIHRANLNLSGWIANHVIPDDNYHQEYLFTLKEMLSFPFLGEIPWINNCKNCNSLAQYIFFEKIK